MTGGFGRRAHGVARHASTYAACIILSTCGAARDPAEPGGGAQPLSLAWQVAVAPIRGLGWGGVPAVDGGRLFVQAEYDALGLSATDGRLLWRRRIQFRGGIPWATVYRADAGRVYVSQVDSVYCLDGATGATVWSAAVPNTGARATPALDAATFYTGTSGVPVVQAYDRSTGRVRWATDVSAGRGWAFSADVVGAAVSGDTVYATVMRNLTSNGGERTGVLVALARQDGRELWRYEAPGRQHQFTDAPLVAPGRIVVNDLLGFALVAIAPASQQVVWRVPMDRNGPTTSALVDGAILSANGDASVTKVDPESGVVRWRRDIGSSPFGAAVCGRAFVVTNGWLRSIDVASGRESQRLGGPSTELIPSTGIATDGGFVYGMGRRDTGSDQQQEFAWAVRCG